MLFSKNNTLFWAYDLETLKIEAWGPNSLRVRCVRSGSFPSEDWALYTQPAATSPEISVPKIQPSLPAPGTYTEEPLEQISPAVFTNGAITARVTTLGKLTIHNNQTNTCLLEEYTRTRLDTRDPKTSPLNVNARDFRTHGSGATDYHLTYRIESQSMTEKIYGMGQYQQPYLDLKGTDMELAQRNSQASIPFFISSLGYGFLWNNPAVGRAVLGKNIMTFEASSTQTLDFWITTCDTPAQIMSNYADATGHAPMMPEYGLGFWQSKLRYQTQEELLLVAREYKKRELPIDVIVVDFFHWPCQGEWKWDAQFWPDPGAMVKELQSMNIELVVSVWPTVDKRSENYQEMYEKGFLIRAERGLRIAQNFMGETTYADFTNPDARTYVWNICKKNYFDLGIRSFWLDEAEPEFGVYSFENWRYAIGAVSAIGNVYPARYAQAFYDGQRAASQRLGGKDGIVNLIRCAWAGSQRHASLLWSGDIASSWTSFRNQLAAGLNCGLAGIPWWTTDIGGFHGGDPRDPDFRELLVRWFQWGAFCPVMRLHGTREPMQPKLGHGGGSDCRSGAPNEVWSYGDECYGILATYLRLREQMRGYVRRLMREASEKGAPVMRTMFYEFPHDETCWSPAVEDQYMFGDVYLVAPVFEPKMSRRSVYLPAGTRWALLRVKSDGSMVQGQEYAGGQRVQVETTISDIPVFFKDDAGKSGMTAS